ncbi:hypothetical protein LHYA1_G005775 [Lachnellula hyalina]|uniref:Uncharacterized protein n=1 Tax=Lachnellula hyalina TaxID=1316788 RepID=A0A8H8TZ74_9HELO|nr:uncharacterized protein LHYA1_G005775 [Lachnellula hyalina]TVY25552.1 hypothetical protein LHYA1_G005775 [Lachnellula hyalina]
MANITQVGSKIFTYALIIPLLLFYPLLLCGCVSTSPGIPNLHLVQIEVDDETKVRVGYYGICAIGTDNTDCIASAFLSNSSISKKFQKSLRGQPLSQDSLNEAIKLQTKVFLNVFVIAGLLLFFGLFFELIRICSTKRKRKTTPSSSTIRRQNFYRQFSLALAWASSAFTLAAAAANTQTGKGLKQTSEGTISPGQTSLALHWVAWSVSLLFSFGLTMLHRGRSGVASQAGKMPDSSFD